MNGNKDRSDFLAWLGGADLEVLEKAPRSEHTRFVQMAIVLLTTSGIGALSMMFALHHGVGQPLAVAIIGGITWGFVLLNLDRFLVLSMGHTRSKGRLLLMALPRLALAAVISLVVATPMTLWIFANDITNEMVQVNATESKQVAQEQLQSGPATQAATTLQQITTDKQILAGHLQGTTSSTAVTFWQSKVTALTPQVQQAQQTMDTKLARYQCEVDGSGPVCKGASKLRGLGPIAKLKDQEYIQAQQNYQGLDSQLKSAQQHLAKAQTAAAKASGHTLAQQQAQARAELPGLQKQYNALEATLKKNQTQAEGAVEGNVGLLAQLHDLSVVGAKNPSLRVAQLLVTLLFFCIEILPVLVKVLLNIGPLSVYETLLKNEEDIVTDKATLTRVTKRRDAEREADKQIAIDEHMRQLEEGLGKKANQHVIDHMESILDVALDDWSNQVKTQLAGQAAPPAGGTAGGQAPPGPSGRHGKGGNPGGGAHGGGSAQAPGNGSSAKGSGTSSNGTNSNGTSSNGKSGSGTVGSNGSGQAPTVTFTTSPASGHSLPDDDDEDLL
jgi:hypothetical protein